ncbi:threonine-phosphate decarboxylase CobD [Clostridium tarantellae]|uniref:threonine-phosphate decarboxylase CobD n=1 Tax=Clostridium tarantellae TaxID=39493 RepID=UPI0014792473|nr:threonine-phosphate decarboxylase CobD [Clostridium tarantellae]
MKTIRSNSHGGNLYLASKEFGINEGKFLDYSANINPLGVPKDLEKLIKNNISKLVNYPNIDYSLLTEQISNYLKVNKKNIVVGNGATEVIYLTLEALKLKKVCMPCPTFSEYKGACNKFNIEIDYYNLKEENNFNLHIEDFKNYIDKDTSIEGIFLCNPNNPTSTLLNKKQLLDILFFANEKHIFVVLDESFIDLTNGDEKNSIKDFVKEYKNLIIIRSFTKFFGIPGLRLGCGICNEDLAKELIKIRLPWSINYFATLVGEILKEDNDYIINTKKWINEERDWFYSELKSIKKIKVFYPNTNFILVKLLDENIDSVKLREKLGEMGILIRDCSNFNNLSNKYVRFAIKDRDKNEKFIKNLKQVLN